jgi:hypothetical protein
MTDQQPPETLDADVPPSEAPADPTTEPTVEPTAEEAVEEVAEPINHAFDLPAAFQGLQERLLNSHATIRAVTKHPGTLGDHSEVDWVTLLRDFLPSRYAVGPIFAVDSRGVSSEQIDVAVYDKQYSPMWFGSNAGVEFVPVEAVYAAFEAKPSLTPAYIAYTEKKLASVRQLHRTSAAIKYAGGIYRAVDPSEKHLIGGILTAHSSWTTYDGTVEKLKTYLPASVIVPK